MLTQVLTEIGVNLYDYIPFERKMVEATYQDISQVLSDIVNRIRSLESKYNVLGERMLIVNENMISQFKKNKGEARVTSQEIKDIKAELFQTRGSFMDLTKQMEFFATKENIKVLEKYINLWDPFKFVTEKELEKKLEILKNEKRK